VYFILLSFFLVKTCTLIFFIIVIDFSCCVQVLCMDYGLHTTLHQHHMLLFKLLILSWAFRFWVLGWFLFFFLQTTCAVVDRVLVSRIGVQFPHKLLQFVGWIGKVFVFLHL
jgi:hypothetical protein